MTTVKPTTQNDNTCCLWLKNADVKTKAKAGIVITLTALAAIALVTAALIIIAQQGVNLGGFNAVAQMIDAAGVYAWLAVAGVILIVDVVILIALSRRDSKIYSAQEMQKYNVTDGYLNEKMDAQSYWTVDKPGTPAANGTEATPPLFL